MYLSFNFYFYIVNMIERQKIEQINEIIDKGKKGIKEEI